MKKFKNESKSKSPMKITLFVMIFFMIIGFSSLSITRFITGGVNLGFNFDDVNIYIANLYTNNINRFNSISEDKTSFNIELQNGTNNVDIYVSNNSTQYDEYINFVCNESDLNGVSITPNEDNTNIAYSQVILKNTFVIENTGGTQTLNCRLENLEVESTTKVVEKKRVIFALDGIENETAFKYVDSLTYGDLPIIELYGYEFLGWYKSNDELVESTTEITNFSDEILYGKLKSLCILGQVWNFDYTGGEQTFTAPCDGEYKLETWGAQGGYGVNTNKENGLNQWIVHPGGYGAYSAGSVSLVNDQKVYINVGGEGTSTAKSTSQMGITQGGYNGGGNGYIYAGGGGATHISLSTGLLSTFSNNKNNLLIVSGGGAGTAAHFEGGGFCNGGSGGGYKGNDGISGVENVGYNHNTFVSGAGATQTTGFAFGKGYSYSSGINHSGGGGGFYGGMNDPNAYTSWYSCSGGGSGYIGNSSLTNKSMYCYNCTPSSVESTKTISTKCKSETPTENCAKQGDGYARITFLGKNIQ